MYSNLKFSIFSIENKNRNLKNPYLHKLWNYKTLISYFSYINSNKITMNSIPNRASASRRKNV